MQSLMLDTTEGMKKFATSSQDLRLERSVEKSTKQSTP